MPKSLRPFLFFLVSWGINWAAVLHASSYPFYPWGDYDPDDYFDAPGSNDSLQESFSSNDDDEPSRAQNFNGGFLTYSLGAGDDAARAGVIQTDGKLVLVGRKYIASGNSDFAITRFNPDGELDTSFNTSGVLVHSFGTGDEIAHAAVLQTDGKVIAVGRGESNSGAGFFNFAIARYTTGGSLDTSYNSSGLILTNLNGHGDIARGATLDTAGRLIVAGFTNVSSVWKFASVRYNTDGTLDTTFNTSGAAAIGINNKDAGATSVAFMTNAIFLGGNAYNGTNWDVAVVRLLSNGQLDTSFKTSGIATYAIGSGDDTAYATTVQTDGKALTAGAYYNGSNLDFLIVRLATNGALDTTYNTTGSKFVAVGSGADGAFGIVLQSDAKSLVGGYSYNGTNNDFAIIRLLTNGGLDTTFNTTGKRTTAILSAEDTAQAISILDQDYIVLIGRAYNGSNFDFAVARFNTDGSTARSGTLDQGFGNSGVVTSNISGTDSALAGMIDSTGRLLWVGATGTSDFAVVRYTVDGNLDTTFNTSGKKTVNISGNDKGQAVAIDTNGSIVIGGKTGTPDFAIIRLLSDGTLDTAFNTRGIATQNVGASDIGYGVAIQSDGMIQLGGSNASGMYVLRYRTDGRLDTTFGTKGIFADGNLNEMDSIYLLTTGKTILCGSFYNSSSDFAIARINSNGTLDTSFKTAGYNNAVDIGTHADAIYSCIETSDGRIIASGASDAQGAILRFLTNGSLDTTFQTSGVFLYSIGTSGADDVNGVVEAPGKKYIFSGTKDTNWFITRLLSDGRLDTSFRTNGQYQDANLHTEARRVVLRKNGKICALGESGYSIDAGVSCIWP